MECKRRVGRLLPTFPQLFGADKLPEARNDGLERRLKLFSSFTNWPPPRGKSHDSYFRLSEAVCRSREHYNLCAKNGSNQGERAKLNNNAANLPMREIDDEGKEETDRWLICRPVAGGRAPPPSVTQTRPVDFIPFGCSNRLGSSWLPNVA